MECLRRAEAAGIGWPVLPEIDDVGLERRLYPPEPGGEERPLPV